MAPAGCGIPTGPWQAIGDVCVLHRPCVRPEEAGDLLQCVADDVPKVVDSDGTLIWRINDRPVVRSRAFVDLGAGSGQEEGEVRGQRETIE